MHRGCLPALHDTYQHDVFLWGRAGVTCHAHQQKETELGDETAPIQGAQESRTSSETRTVHEAAEQILRVRHHTDEHFPGIIHVSHQLALLHGHDKVFFCKQCGAVNAGGTLRLLKSQCDCTGESRQKARRKLERGLIPNARYGRCEARILIAAQNFLDFAVCFESPRIVNLMSHPKNRWRC